MKSNLLLSLLLLGVLLTIATSCTERSETRELIVRLEPRSESQTTGEVSFIQVNETVTLQAKIDGLIPLGTHAIHLHESSDCTAPDATSTGGHWNPTFERHGAWGSDSGFHRGDIGNFEADQDGVANFTFSTDLWCIGCEDRTKNIIGKAIIVHQGADDLVSQPSGAAGARITCGGIIQDWSDVETDVAQ